MHGVYPGIAWMPDSKQVVAWAKGKLWRIDPFKSSAAEIPFHVKDERQITPVLRFAHGRAFGDLRLEDAALGQGALTGRQARGVLVRRLSLHERAARRPTGRRSAPTHVADGTLRVLPGVLARWQATRLRRAWTDADQGRVRVLRPRRRPRHDRHAGARQIPVAGASRPDGKTVAYQKAKGGFLTSPWNSLEPGVYVAAAGRQGPAAPRHQGRRGAPVRRRQRHALRHAQADDGEVDSNHQLVRLNLVERSEFAVAKSEFATRFTVSPDGQWLGFTERFHTYVRRSRPRASCRRSARRPRRCR